MPQCSFCKKQGLKWKRTAEGKWRLYKSDGKIHNCSKFDAALERVESIKEAEETEAYLPRKDGLL